MIPRTTERPSVIGLRYDGQYEEGRIAADADDILPGMLIEITDEDDGTPVFPCTVQPHSDDAAACVVRIAVEDRLGGLTKTSVIGRNKNTPYTVDEDGVCDLVPYIAAKAGDVFQLRVPNAAAYTKGTKLESAGDGTFRTTGTGAKLAEIEENFDYSDDDSGDETVLIRARIL